MPQPGEQSPQAAPSSGPYLSASSFRRSSPKRARAITTGLRTRWLLSTDRQIQSQCLIQKDQIQLGDFKKGIQISLKVFSTFWGSKAVECPHSRATSSATVLFTNPETPDAPILTHRKG